MLIFILLYAFFTKSEGRVFCQDSHAQPWVHLGHSCPINCGNIITAVKRLKALQYKKMLLNNGHTYQTENTMQLDDQNNSNNENPRRNYIVTESEIKIYRKYYEILKNVDVAKDLKNELKTISASIKSCAHKNKKSSVFYSKLSKCARKSNIQGDFLVKFTSILNKYSTTAYPFTEELSAMILEQVLGKNLDLRQGLFDVKQILSYLTTVIERHEEHRDAESGQVVTLKSSNCMSVRVPGCYCVPGFVESFGQCVMPSDCFPGTLNYKEYLAQIIVY